jgi:hypothetical protein
MLYDKSIFTFPMILLIIFILLTNYSCNNNPINSGSVEYQFDSSRYRWEFNDIYSIGDPLYQWAPDTGEVFIPDCGYNQLIHFKNNQMSYISFGDDVRIGWMSGFSKNEGYLLCVKIENNLRKPLLKKWDGNSFSDISIIYDSTRYYNPGPVLFKSPNEIWIAETRTIEKFDGIKLNYYNKDETDTLISPTNLFYDEFNKLKYLTTYFNLSIDSLQKDRIFEFNGTSWNKVYEDIHPVFSRVYYILGKDVCAFDGTNFFKLKGNSLELITSYPQNENSLIFGNFNGSSVNDFLVFGYRDYKEKIFHWNGKKWSIEVNTQFNMTKITKPSDNFYCAVVYNIFTPSLIRGFKKEIK